MKTKLLLALVLSWLCIVRATGQDTEKQVKLNVKKGMQVVMRDTTYTTLHDTVLVVTEAEAAKIKVREDPYAKSSKFYTRAAKQTSTHKLQKRVFGWVVKKKPRKPKSVNTIVKSEDAFKPYTGFIIESITFKGVDLIEGSVTDTLQKANTKIGIFINKVHKDTRAKIISNNLLFKVGDAVDPYRFADNERVLRQFKTLRDARIYISPAKTKGKFVDVVVVTQDVGSIGAAGSYRSPQHFRLYVYDINILGYARQLRLSYFRNSGDTKQNGYEITIREPNFKRTFIQGELQYTDNYLRQRTRLALARDFFTPEIKYAGGIELYRTREKFYFEEYDTLELPYTENNADVWAGRSFQLDKRTNLIFSSRLISRDFVRQPFVSSDSNSFFYNGSLLLGSVTLTQRNYMKSLRIRGFGRTEDVPIGGLLTVIVGRDFNQFVDRSYLELDATIGRYFPVLGYINLTLAAGHFIKNSKTEDGLITVTSTYFSDLIRLRKMQARQFIYFTYTKGFNRVLDRTISLPGKWEDQHHLPPLGNLRMTLGFETVYFMPWYLYGFQFALFHRVDFNAISTSPVALTRDTLFPSIQFGMRILNENLVLPRFSFDVAYFGRNHNFIDGWQFKFSTAIPNLFGTNPVFKPQVSLFN